MPRSGICGSFGYFFKRTEKPSQGFLSRVYQFIVLLAVSIPDLSHPLGYLLFQKTIFDSSKMEIQSDLIFLFLMAKDVEHFHNYLLAFCIFSLKNSVLRSPAHF